MNFILKFTFHFVKDANELYAGGSLTCPAKPVLLLNQGTRISKQ